MKIKVLMTFIDVLTNATIEAGAVIDIDDEARAKSIIERGIGESAEPAPEPEHQQEPAPEPEPQPQPQHEEENGEGGNGETQQEKPAPSEPAKKARGGKSAGTKKQ